MFAFFSTAISIARKSPSVSGKSWKQREYHNFMKFLHHRSLVWFCILSVWRCVEMCVFSSIQARIMDSCEFSPSGIESDWENGKALHLALVETLKVHCAGVRTSHWSSTFGTWRRTLVGFPRRSADDSVEIFLRHVTRKKFRVALWLEMTDFWSKNEAC